MFDLFIKSIQRFYLALVILNIVLFALEYKAKPVIKKSNKWPSIVRLTQSGQTFCTGTVINKHTILTAAHCVVREGLLGPEVLDGPIEIRTNNNDKIGVFGLVYFSNSQTDHALIQGDFSRFETNKYITDVQKLVNLQRREQKFTACGYPLYGNLFCNTVYYNDLTNFMWFVDGLILPGMSGGPVMLEDGTVVGTNTAVQGNKSVISPLFNLDNEIKE